MNNIMQNNKNIESNEGKTIIVQRVLGLDENSKISISNLIEIMNVNLLNGFINTLQQYACSNSRSYVKTIINHMVHFIKNIQPESINDKAVMQYKDIHPTNLRVLRPFIIKWFEFGYPGVDENAVELLKHFDLKIKKFGQEVLQDDPNEGPLTKHELDSLIKAITNAYGKGELSLSDYAISLLISMTGRRPQQLVLLKYKDIKKKNISGDLTEFLISMPRVKQRDVQQQYRDIAIIPHLASVIVRQANDSVDLVEKVLGMSLDDKVKGEIPIFLNKQSLCKLEKTKNIFELTNNDVLNAKPSIAHAALTRIVKFENLISSRTGLLLKINPRRLRHTIATLLAQDGHDASVIAELLDHSSTSSVGIYIKNLADSAERIDNAVTKQLSFLADIFMYGMKSKKDLAFKFFSTKICQAQNSDYPCDQCAFFIPFEDIKDNS
ncbi:tyrosine-type recombinase/integrase [Rahnella selenatireducens]|uniref:tyrosine-type recombinase/integrase n=1 Tax=Rahnella selenatireducens TaxID=3389797 RepID=UPI0039692FDD